MLKIIGHTHTHTNNVEHNDLIFCFSYKNKKQLKEALGAWLSKKSSSSEMNWTGSIENPPTLYWIEKK